jgi:hypothetical protein
MRSNCVARLLVIAVCALIVSGESSAEPVDTLTVEEVYESFIDEDFVVEGTIESIEKQKIPRRDFSPSISTDERILNRLIPMARVAFKVSRVLIGELDKSEITVVGMVTQSQDFTFDLEEGDRYIVALHYIDRGAFNKGGTYPLRRDDSRFLIKGNRWFRGRKGEFMGTGRLGDLYRAIEEIRKMRSIESISREADLIVRGTVIDIWSEDEGTVTGQTMHVRYIELNLSAVLKGNIKENDFTFQMLPYVNYRPPWYKLVSVVSPGEEWIVFLKWIPEIGYYPFAGKNGMFKVDNDRLIRDNRLVLKQTPENLEKDIARAISGGGDSDEK